MEKEFIKAQFMWSQLSGFQKIDSEFCEPILNLDAPSPPTKGWLKFYRCHLQISQPEMAFRLGISKQAYSVLEKNEINGSISLGNLQSVADAMDCDLIYFLRTKSKKPLAEILWQAILPSALKIYKQRVRATVLKPLPLAKMALELFKKAEFRSQMNWSRNISTSLKD